MILHAAAGELRHDGRTAWFTPFQTRLIEALAAVYPAYLFNEHAYCSLWPDGEPDSAYNAVGVQIVRIRAKLKAAGMPPLIGTATAGARTALLMRVEVTDRKCDVIPANLGKALRSLLHTHPNHAAADRILAVLG